MGSEYSGFEIAVVGMAGRFPGSKNVNELWENLCKGRNLITYFTDDELRQNGISEEYIKDKSYVKARGILNDIDKFDAELFGFYPKEIELLDPQQRIFLECCWEAMEDAGYCPDNYEGLTGIFGGIGLNTYVLQSIHSRQDLKVSAEAYQLSIANDKDFLTTRVSYKLNMRGPSVNVQTACSTSLAATHIACMNLFNYQCDLALAGGCTITMPETSGYHYQEGMILSPDGYCRPFDKNAGGTVASNGCGIVVLKRLADAIEDNDDIYAVIKGSAYNNDGAIKVGYTAPGVNGQTEVLSAAFSMADIPLDSIGYIETHGTGTALGDPIEIDALNQVFSSENIPENSCAIGSVKSNVGHLDTAAGVTGLIKAVLSVYHGLIPPSINFESPNPKIDFQKTPFYVNTELKKWGTDSSPRRAGVSSFGIGGTNAHVILEQAPLRSIQEDDGNFRIVPFSAKNKKSLDQIIESYRDYLSKSDVTLRDLAFTLQTGRKEFDLRKFTLAENIDELSKNLDAENSKKMFSGSKIYENPSLIFLFSGQGSQYINMCLGLFEKDRIFNEYFIKCIEILKEEKNYDLREIIYPSIESDKEYSEKLNQTIYAQPALFVIEYSLAMSFIERGIRPNFMAGHSIGEYVAACVAGVLDLKSSLKLVSTRGELMQSLESGSMLSIKLSERELSDILPDTLDLAVLNSPNMCVVSGNHEEIEKFKIYLDENDIFNTKLETSHAFHSRMMDPILNEFKSVVSQMNLKPPSIPYMSNVSGDFIKETEATDPQYYVNHLRYAVRFSENIKNLLAVQYPIFIEIGPGKTLTSLTKLNSQNTDNILINTVKHKRQEISDYEILLTAVGKLWLAGVNIDWQNYSSEKSFKAHLPTYAFNKKRYWIKSKPVKNSNDRSNQSLSNLNNWIYRTSWERLSLEYLPSQNSYNENIIVFEDQNCRVSNSLKSRVNGNLVKVHPGKSFKRIDSTAYHINPNNPDDYLEIFKSIVKDGIDVNHIIHSWSVTGDIHDTKTIAFDDYQILGYISLIYIAKSLGEIDSSEKIGMQVISSNIFDILGDEEIIAEKTTLLGAVRVIRQEKPNLDISILEIDDFDKNPQLISNWLLHRFEKVSDNFSTAIRGKYYWQQTFKKIDHSGNSLLKSNGTYLITGGLGRIALGLADHLAKNYQSNIILVDKFNIPPKNDWESYLSEDQNSADMNKRIEKLIKIDKIAESLTVINNDISNLEELKSCIGNVLSEFKKIDGIIHAAGNVGGGMVKLINDFNLNDYDDQIKPKINGTINISQAIKELQLDFVFVQSSLASLLGGIGFSNYSAVNNFIDSFSLLKNRETKNGTNWISVNWDGWNFDENTGAEGINPDQGIELFKKALIENSRGNIIISKGDLNESVQKWIDSTHKNTDVDDEEKDSESENHERPDLDNEYVQPETEIEKQICQEWENLLGIQGIGVNDNFFDLGGDSLIGTQLVSRLRKIYNTDIPLVSVFENATVRGIAAILQSNKVNDPDTELMADIFEKVDQMSEEEIAKILSKKNNQN